MKIAISSTGDDIDSLIDQRFGRCSYFVIFETESKTIEFIPNPNRDNEEGAGPASVQLVASHQVSKIISGEFGIKIKPLLDSLKIQMIVIKDRNMKVREAIEMISH